MRDCVLCLKPNPEQRYPDEIRVCRACEVARHTADLDGLTPETFVAESGRSEGGRPAAPEPGRPLGQRAPFRQWNRPARDLGEQLRDADIEHAFTGLPAAWALDQFARFRLASVYVSGDPRDAADILGLRRDGKGANAQLIGPDDRGVFSGAHEVDGIRCVSPVQVYLDLSNLPERAAEAAEQMRTDGSLRHTES